MPSSPSRDGAPSRPRPARRLASLVLLALVIAFAVTSVTWLRSDTAPPLWDSAHYLQHSAVVFHALQDGGLTAFFDAFSSSMDRKAPLITALPIPFYVVFGESHQSARYVNLVWIAVSSLFLFRLGRLLLTEEAALFAVVLLQTFPLVAGMSRQFLVEYGLMTLVILWMYYLVRWQLGDSRAVPWILGVILGFGLLLKVTFPLYVAAPAVLALVLKMKAGGTIANLAKDLARIGAAALPISMTWYGRNLAEVSRFVLDAGFGEAARPYGTGPVFSVEAIATYWLKLLNAGISGLYAVVFLVILAGLALAVLRRPERVAPGARTGELRLVVVWWLVPFLMLTVATNKDPRYSIAYLPAVALLFAAAATRWIPPRRRSVALAAIAAAGVLNFSAYSFGSPAFEPDVRLGRLVLLSNHTAWAHPPEADAWPGEDVVRAVAEDASVAFGKDRVRVRVLFSHPRINAHVFNYLATLHELTPRFTTVHFQNPLGLEQLIAEIGSGYDYVLTKSGDLGPRHLNERNREVAAALERGELAFPLVSSVPLPDGTRISIHRRPAPTRGSVDGARAARPGATSGDDQRRSI